jgi:antirestriction protein ArdC
MTATKTRTRRPAADKPRRDPFAEVTDRIVALMEAGTNPWRKPWTADGAGLPRSIGTGKGYRGINPFLLLITSMEKGYTSPWWGTYKAITEKGGQVRKGEKGTQVVFWSTFASKDPKEVDAKGNPKQLFFLRSYTVFNAEQADDLPARFFPKAAERTEFEVIEQCQAVVDGYLARTGIAVTHGGNRAAYSPGLDTIVLPDREAFTRNAEYYGTAFHELAHSTGHESRLNRPELNTFAHFGDNPYSKEELVAEQGAAMVAGITGIGPLLIDNSAAYLASWAKALRGDSKLVVRAASAAQKAADLILGPDHFESDEESAEQE